MSPKMLFRCRNPFVEPYSSAQSADLGTNTLASIRIFRGWFSQIQRIFAIDAIRGSPNGALMLFSHSSPYIPAMLHFLSALWAKREEILTLLPWAMENITDPSHIAAFDRAPAPKGRRFLLCNHN